MLCIAEPAVESLPAKIGRKLRMNDIAAAQLAELLKPEVGPFIDNIPLAMQLELLADDRGFVTRNQMTAELASRFTKAMRHLPSPDALRAVLPQTEFFRTRMQPLAGALGAVACRPHPQYSYFPYIPLANYLDDSREATLIVAVHGSSRNAQVQRNGFAEFAENNKCFVMAPLFPIDLSAQTPDEEYKYVAGSNVRFDNILFDMIADFEESVGFNFSRIFLCGFSGGGQFAHRLFYAHADRIDALSIGAPGFVTLPSADHDWWIGIRDLQAKFGKEPNFDAMRRVPVHMVCGADDTIPFEIYSRDEMGLSELEYADYGSNRVHRIKRLKAAFDEIGINAHLELLDECTHSFEGAIADAMQRFFLKHL
jgi:predicted esterase